MDRIRKNEAGFSPVEVVIVLVIVALIGVVGWLVYRNHNKTSTTTVSTTNTSNASKPTSHSGMYEGWQTYKGDGFNLKYPADWKYVTKGTVAGGGEFAFDEFLPTANYPDNNAHSIAFETATTNNTVSEYASNQGSSEGQVSAKIITINGSPAYTVNYNVPGPSGVPYGYSVYIGHNIGHNGLIVILHYVAGNSDKYKSTYENIANSIQFTN